MTARQPPWPGPVNTSRSPPITGAGTTTITAWQEGNANYQAAAGVPQVLTVTVPTGLEPLVAAGDFQVYPNPASGQVTIRSNKVIGRLVFYNVTGTVVFEKQVKSPECNIPVQEIGSPGIYFFKVNSITKKIGIVH